MGLFPGVEVKIIKDDPFVIAVHGSRLVLGRGIACKISVY
jgi:Fe2+ transport system protein FeoA